VAVLAAAVLAFGGVWLVSRLRHPKAAE
jgi:hypothetical protein